MVPDDRYLPAEVLFGVYNPSGRLPLTFYKHLNQIPDFLDYNMAGRTYRYFKGEPLYPFGFGLSYTHFSYGEIQCPETVRKGEPLHLSVDLTNDGNMDGDEVVQVYLRKIDDKEGPLKTLRAFRRLPTKAGQTVKVEFDLTPKQMEWWNPHHNVMGGQAGIYEIMIGTNSRDLVTHKIEIVD